MPYNQINVHDTCDGVEADRNLLTKSEELRRRGCERPPHQPLPSLLPPTISQQGPRKDIYPHTDGRINTLNSYDDEETSSNSSRRRNIALENALQIRGQIHRI